MLAFTSARLSIWAPGRSLPEPDLRADPSPSAMMLGELMTWYRHIREHHTQPPGLDVTELDTFRGDLALLRSVRAQIGAEMFCYVGEVGKAVDAVTRAVATLSVVSSGSAFAGLYDVNWMDRCPVLGPARSHRAWPELHRAVAGRAAEIRAAIEGR